MGIDKHRSTLGVFRIGRFDFDHGRLEGWNDGLIRDFGRACVKRTRERVGFLPVISGYVYDAERLAGLGRVPLAAFAAARAAEWCDGPAGYEEERRLQAVWLAERLGLGPFDWA